MSFHANLARLGGLFLRERHGQNSVLVLGFHLLCVDGVGQSEVPNEGAVTALDAMVSAAVGLERPLAFQSQGVVLNLNVNVPQVENFDEFTVGIRLFQDTVNRLLIEPSAARPGQ